MLLYIVKHIYFNIALNVNLYPYFFRKRNKNKVIRVLLRREKKRKPKCEHTPE